MCYCGEGTVFTNECGRPGCHFGSAHVERKARERDDNERLRLKVANLEREVRDLQTRLLRLERLRV